MKKFTVMLFSAFLLVGCGNDADTTKTDQPAENKTETTDQHIQEGKEVTATILKTLPEYETLIEFIDVDAYTVTSQTENKGNRILVFHNEQDEAVYKSIFVKDDQRLKMIDLADDHLLLNDIISTDATDHAPNTDKRSQDQSQSSRDESSKKNQNASLEAFEEYETIAKEIDLDQYTGSVQTDNQGNRIILFANEQGENDYKSIFVKHQNHLKIVALTSDQLLFNGVID